MTHHNIAAWGRLLSKVVIPHLLVLREEVQCPLQSFARACPPVISQTFVAMGPSLAARTMAVCPVDSKGDGTFRSSVWAST